MRAKTRSSFIISGLFVMNWKNTLNKADLALNTAAY